TAGGSAPVDDGGEVGPELLGQAVVGIVVEAAVLPPGVGVEGNRAAHRPTTGQSAEATQLDADFVEIGLERVGVELRIPIRTGQSADIDDHLGAGVRQQFGELVQ